MPYHQLESNEYMDILRLKSQIEFKLRLYPESTESILNLITLQKKNSTPDELLPTIFDMIGIKCYSRPNEAIHYLENHVLQKYYVKANDFNRQVYLQLHFVDPSY